MNFNFTNKIKNFTFILMGIGVILFVLGFLGEKSHIYMTPHNEESLAILHKYETVGYELLTQSEQKYFNKNKGGAPLKDAETILVEYHHETPFTADELKQNIAAAAKEKNIEVTFSEMGHHATSHSNDHNNHKSKHTENHHQEVHHADTTHHDVMHSDGETTHQEATHGEGTHHDGNAEGASEEHDDTHGFMFLATPSEMETHHDEKVADDHHGGHGATNHHSPIETLEHIIHEEGTFADSHHTRTWSNLLVNAFFFFGIGLGALFFIALQYATESGWGVVSKRILEAITSYIKVGWIFLVIVFAAGALGLNHIYHWMDPDVMNPNKDDFDPIIAGKQPFLSQAFFWIANVVYFGVFIFFAWWFRKRSLREDVEGGTKIHMGNYAKGAIFLVLFGYLSSVMSWHWIMSIDTHWFSTLFGWYVFSGIWISAIITILLMIFFLKGKGYLEFINESHIHDLGKWLFAVSILWSYLFFSQFMLIWYADIPEEVTYYVARFTDYKFILWTVFAVNLILPLVFLMSREAKRSRQIVTIVGSILLVTHWLDVFIMVMPGTVFDHWKIGILEIGMFLAFLGFFIFVVFTALTKAPMLVKNHPYLDENLHQHT